LLVELAISPSLINDEALRIEPFSLDEAFRFLTGGELKSRDLIADDVARRNFADHESRHDWVPHSCVG
jgi:hypothetical protein